MQGTSRQTSTAGPEGRILVVEDQRAAAGALRMRLRGLGYDVIDIALSGDEAVAKARDLEPDLILMDIRLGEGIDGIEAARRIRTQSSAPIVYVTAYADHELLGRARETQPAGFINKPFTTKDLLTTLNLALHRHETEADHAPGQPRIRDAVLTTDQNGDISFITSSAEQLIGWSRQEIIGQPLKAVLASLYPISEREAGDVIDAVLEGGQASTLARTDEQGHESHDALIALSDTQANRYGLALHFGGQSLDSSVSVVQRLANAYQFVLDRVPIGVIVIDTDRNISHVNSHAREILDNTELLQTRNSALRCVDAAHDDGLKQLIARLTAPRDDASGAESEMITFGDKDERCRLVAIASPIPEVDTALQAPLITVLLFDMTHRRELSESALRQTYGLTRSEVKLVQNLVGGCSLEDGARELGITVNTARTHLKHIFTKTGARRQSELIHQIETGPASLAIEVNNPKRRRGKQH
ncbi:MAG: response regulator [Gammaproteobacteria bacterium]